MLSKGNDTINVNNYEEWLVLYMDNELTVEQKAEVETFLLLHPHLQEEMDLLWSTKLPLDKMSFAGKEELYATSMKLTTVDEPLLLYIDNELSSAEKKSVEEKLASNPDYRLQHALLVQTKFNSSEIIAHPNKKELYRRTEKVVPFAVWMRIAVAVIVMLVATYFFVFTADKNPATTNYVARQNKPQEKQNKSSLPTIPVHATMLPQQQAVAVTTSVREKKEKKIISHKSAVLPDNIQASQQQLNISQEENAIALHKTETIHIDVKKLAEQPTVALNNLIAKSIVTSVIPASYNNTENGDGPDEDYQPNKTPAKGFLRKVSRFIEKRTGIGTVNADNEILVGAVALKLN